MEVIFSQPYYNLLWAILSSLILISELDLVPEIIEEEFRSCAIILAVILTPDSLTYPSFYLGCFVWFFKEKLVYI